jgi:hypothetical protein
MGWLLFGICALMAGKYLSASDGNYSQCLIGGDDHFDADDQNCGLPAPSFNIDGTPMLGDFDMNGHMYGCTSAHFGGSDDHSHAFSNDW